ncbi:Piso0_000064 [Millerozyma farinosa CBS 7064]|uniref:Piso0_000064 protein n=1 Tax=Pichia sorbitophila (strain ATCC MYA-4447 / BCRC 22081 / CBS 7064 / NBRC 10061 / NRRL Y-12695) TaxID=559304 RepID=G8YT02_PICSO|nr:Piso0_000064 [Millerozyma farinosa CBS 7064]
MCPRNPGTTCRTRSPSCSPPTPSYSQRSRPHIRSLGDNTPSCCTPNAPNELPRLMTGYWFASTLTPVAELSCVSHRCYSLHLLRVFLLQAICGECDDP